MSYLVLARKWRPKSFDTLVGQEHVVRALTHALESRRLHHAYLFTGTRGIGKTTIARILAKALNCETGISARPCGTCSACTEIDSGRFVDLLEVDAATNTRVDEMRQLLESASYAPAVGRFKVYVIDEVHMLSTSAFNAMLKTLEEPPEHVKFILATTDPQKIPVTVLSRCLQFNLKQMPPQHIVEHLTRVLEAEQVAVEPPALRLLARAAAGSMRDALSLLDQAIAHGAGRVEVEAVRSMLGTVGEDHLFEVLDGLAGNDVHAMLAVADAMDARSLSFDSALQELATLIHRIAVFQFAPEAISDLSERARLTPYAQRFDAEFLQLAYQILIQGRADLVLAPDECAGFTMTLLRLVAFRPDTPSALGVATRAPQAVPAPTPVAAASVPAPAKPDAPRLSLPDTEGQRPVPVVGQPDWRQLIGALHLGGLVRELAQHCEWVGHDGSVLQLRLSPTHKSLLTKVATEKLQAELSGHFGQTLKLQVDIGEPERETPAQRVRANSRRAITTPWLRWSRTVLYAT
jgi:DNA polymerase III subunit gamma/tau